jgi:DNA helicase HerA-like ATPase
MLVLVDHDEAPVLARVDGVEAYHVLYQAGDELTAARREGLLPPRDVGGYVVARLKLLGLLGSQGLEEPRKPPQPGAPVYGLHVDRNLLRRIYGVEPGHPGVIWYGSLVGYEDLPLALSVEALTMHLGVFGETGSGKSYGFGYLLELLSEVPVGDGTYSALPALVVDANADYIDYWYEYSRGGSLGSYARVVRVVAPSSPARREPFTHELVIALDQFTARELAEIVLAYRAGVTDLNEMQVSLLERALRDLADEGYSPWELIVREPERVESKVEELVRARLAHHQTARAVVAALEKFHQDLVRYHRVVDSRSRLGRQFIDEATTRPSLVIVDFSAEGAPGLPLSVKQLVVAYLARLLYNMFTEFKVVGDERYMLLAIEEAQNYAPNTRTYPVGWRLTRDILALIATQGRKFGICLAVISQRPSFVDPIVISMINTFIVHRLSPDDVAYISKAIGGLPRPLEAKLTRLPRGYALVAGQANMLGEPVVVRVGSRRVSHRMGSTRVVEFLKSLATSSTPS